MNQNHNNIRHFWRPYTGIVYLAICVFDFIVFPIFWSLIQAFYHGNVTTQWQPITLQGAGLIHLAFCGILAPASYMRSKEKIEKIKRSINEDE